MFTGEYLARRFLSIASHFFAATYTFFSLLRNISHFLGEPTLFTGRFFGIDAHIVLLGPCERIGGHVVRPSFFFGPYLPRVRGAMLNALDSAS